MCGLRGWIANAHEYPAAGGACAAGAVHLSPPFLLRKNPRSVPTYTVVVCLGSIAIDRTKPSTRSRPLGLGRPRFVARQWRPPSEVLKTPIPVPAYTVDGTCGSIASANAQWPWRKFSTRRHVAPPSRVLKMALIAPAYKTLGFDGCTASWTTSCLENRLVQLSAPSVLLKTPSSVAT